MTDWVTADWHFNHNKILEFERTNFASIEEHNATIIERYTQKITKDDTCYILGDVGFGSSEELASLIKKLRGRKILVMGNHDRLCVSDYFRMGFAEVHRGPIYYDENNGVGAPAGRIILSHEPVKEALDNPYIINVHGHLHNADLDLPNFFNVNVARTDYYPMPLHRFVNETLRLTKGRAEKIGHEWYWAHYKWDLGKEPSIPPECS